MDKKGVGLSSMYPAVIAIVLVGIVLGIGFFVLQETSNAMSNTAFTVNNETILLKNGTAASVDTADDCGATDFVVVRVHNVTSGEIISSGNYTFSSLGSLLSTSASLYGAGSGNNVNITYTYEGTPYQDSTEFCGALDASGTGLGGLASWIAVIVVVIAAGAVLSIVISSFGSKNSSV